VEKNPKKNVIKLGYFHLKTSNAFKKQREETLEKVTYRLAVLFIAKFQKFIKLKI